MSKDAVAAKPALPGPCYELQNLPVVDREFIYGLDYIDEVVRQYVDTWTIYDVVQGERSERKWAATGRVNRMFTAGPRPARRE